MPIKLKIPSSKSGGFTLSELAIASSISIIIILSAGQYFIGNIKAIERGESLEKQRENWLRTNSFVQRDVALSENIFDLAANPNAITIPPNCYSELDPNSSEYDYKNFVRMGLIQSNFLKPVIYFVKPSDTGWLPQQTLWRCGPKLDLFGRPQGTTDVSRILDGLDDSSLGNGFEVVSVSNDNKEVEFRLSLRGQKLNTVALAQNDASQAQITPLFNRPTDLTYCIGTAFVKIQGELNIPDILTPAVGSNQGKDILICGNGGGDTITGGDQTNEILEAGDNGGLIRINTAIPADDGILCDSGNSDCVEIGSRMDGLSGNDTLRGTDDSSRPDILNGGDGDDSLIGRRGFDLLNGGCGNNEYLPGLGKDIINGDGNNYTYKFTTTSFGATSPQNYSDTDESPPDGFYDYTQSSAALCSSTPNDIVFFENNIEDYTIDSACNNQKCMVTETANPSNSNLLNSVEILIFNNARKDLPAPP